MKHILEKYKNILFGISLLIIGVALGVGITTYFPLLAGIANIKPQLQPVKVVDEAEVKKQALAKFYNEISTANDQKDWGKLYGLVPQSVRNNVTKDEFIAYYNLESEKNKIVSEQTIVNSIQVNGDNGIVDRTRVICTSKECVGDTRKEENAKRDYIYIDGKWQLPDPEPSERALKAANYAYEDSSKTDQADLIKSFGYGSKSSTYTVRNWAVYLDKNLQELVRLETLIEKSKTERSRPVYVQQPAQIIQQQAPAVQQQTFPRNCTSNTIGDYTYTNCY